jgi:hypothetical protein
MCFSIKFLPCHIFPISTYHVNNCTDCTDCTVNAFLSIWQIEQNAISPSYGVGLNPFEVRWVHDKEAYVPVHFEVIPSTLNLEQNLIPLII